MSYRFALGVSTLLLNLIAADAQGQNAPGAVRGLFGGQGPADESHSSQNIDLAFEVSGGFDDNTLPPEISSPSADLVPVQTGYVTTTSTTARYRIGTTERWVRAEGNAFFSYRAIGAASPVEPSRRADVSVGGATPLGKRASLNVGFSAAYEPSVFFTAVEPLAPLEEGSDTSLAPPNAASILGAASSDLGITNQRWITLQGAASLSRNWTPRQQSHVDFGGTRRQPLSGPGYDSDSRAASVRHEWRFRQYADIGFLYRYNDNEQVQEDGTTWPISYQAVEGSMGFERRLSPIRRLSVGLSGGAIRSSSRTAGGREPVDFIGPTVSGVARFIFSRGWAASASGSRSVTVLEGLATGPFTSVSGSVRVEGSPMSRLWMEVWGDYSHGESDAGQAVTFETSRVTAQAQYGITRYWGLLLNYTHYRQEFQDISFGQAPVPNRYRRNSIRVGLTAWLPLLGRF